MAATDTNADTYTLGAPKGLRPLTPQWFFAFEDDVSDLTESGDIRRYFMLAEGSTPLDVMVHMGDHDTHVTPQMTFDVTLYAAIDGQAATEYKLIDASTVAQTGGVARASGTVAGKYLGRRIEADGAYLFIETQTPPATAGTDDRKVVFAALIGNYPPG